MDLGQLNDDQKVVLKQVFSYWFLSLIFNVSGSFILVSSNKTNSIVDIGYIYL